MSTQNQQKSHNLPNGYVSKGGHDPYESPDFNHHHHGTPAYMGQTPKAFTVRVHANKNEFEPGKKMTIATHKIKTFENFLAECTEKLKPTFGAAQRLYTPSGRHRIRKLEDLTEGSIYVATGLEPFKKCNYQDISERQRVPRRIKGFKKIDIARIFTPVEHAHEERYRKKSGRSYYLNEHRRGLILKVHHNGHYEKAVCPVNILHKYRSKMGKILEEIETTMNLTPITAVFRIHNQGYGGAQDFEEIHDAEQLNRDDHILVCTQHKKPEYHIYGLSGKKDFTIRTSPRNGQYYLFPSFPAEDNYRHNKSLNKHRPLPGINSGNQSESYSPYSNPGSQGSRKPNQHKPRGVKQVDYDKDEGGVYRAKKQNNARGARQVNETKDTRTEKPIDQMEAQIVEEEEIHTKEKTTPIPPGTELNKQPSKETKQNADSQTKKSSQERVNEEAAAAKIQAGARGYKARKEFQAKKETMKQERDQRDARRQEEDMRRQEEESRRQAEVSRDQGQPKKAMDEDMAASKIQASFKGYKTRKEMDLKKQQGQK